MLGAPGRSRQQALAVDTAGGIGMGTEAFPPWGLAAQGDWVGSILGGLNIQVGKALSNLTRSHGWPC